MKSDPNQKRKAHPRADTLERDRKIAFALLSPSFRAKPKDDYFAGARFADTL